MRTPVLVLTTVGDGFDARGLARELVEARLAACVNIVERIRSIYRWEGSVAEEAEQLLIIKTSSDRVDELRAGLLARHPYEVPEFVVLSVSEASDAYGRWLLDSTSS